MDEPEIDADDIDPTDIDPADIDEAIDPADIDEVGASVEDVEPSVDAIDESDDSHDVDDLDVIEAIDDIEQEVDIEEIDPAELDEPVAVDPSLDDEPSDADAGADLDEEDQGDSVAAGAVATAAAAATATASATATATSAGPAKTGEPVATGARHDENDRGGLLGWLYLGVLAAIFGVVALLAAGADDVIPEVVAEETTTSIDAAAVGTPAEIQFAVNGDAVTITGSVPDEGARSTIIDSASGRYSTVVDELVIDDGITLIGGTANVSGVAFIGDDDAQGLLNDSANSLGLEAGAFDVELIELDKTPTAAVAAVSTNLVTLTGSFPDQASIDQFVLAATGVFGEANVDSSSLFVDPDTTLTSSTITINGLIDAGDLRGAELQTALGQFFGASTIDGSTLSFDTSPEALGRLETRLVDQLAATPILFESGSAEISAESAAILEQVAVAIIATPDVNVEIVGHTDSSGDAGLNQVLSDDRANAVLGRLVELGVNPERLTARGAGEAEPIADNETDEGKAANRRIAFEFDGAITAEEAAAEAAAEDEAADGEETDEEE